MKNTNQWNGQAWDYDVNNSLAFILNDSFKWTFVTFRFVRNSSISFQNELSFMTFEGQQIQGAPKILEKLQVSQTK